MGGFSISTNDVLSIFNVPSAIITTSNAIETVIQNKYVKTLFKVAQYSPIAGWCLIELPDRLYWPLFPYLGGRLLDWDADPSSEVIHQWRIESAPIVKAAHKWADIIGVSCAVMALSIPIVLHGLKSLAHKTQYKKLESCLIVADKVWSTTYKILLFSTTIFCLVAAVFTSKPKPSLIVIYSVYFATNLFCLVNHCAKLYLTPFSAEIK